MPSTFGKRGNQNIGRCPDQCAASPSIEANDMGMRNLEGLSPSFVHTVSTAGMNTTTTGVLLIKADKTQTAHSDRNRKRAGLPRERLVNFAPKAATMPDRISAALNTNMAPIVTTAWLLNPPSNSFGFKIPQSPKATMTINPITSCRTLSVAKSATDTRRTVKTMAMSRLTIPHSCPVNLNLKLCKSLIFINL